MRKNQENYFWVYVAYAHEYFVNIINDVDEPVKKWFKSFDYLYHTMSYT